MLHGFILYRKKPLFDVKSWSQFNAVLEDDKAYTTNGAEGWNSAFAGKHDIYK